MELQNADTLRWHVYEILTNDVPVSTAIGRDLMEWHRAGGQFSSLRRLYFAVATPDIEIGKDSRAF